MQAREGGPGRGRRHRIRLSIALAAAVALTACGGSSESDPSAGGNERLDVVVGVYPYEFVAERVGGDDVEVHNLAGAGVEPHDLELTPRQVGELAEADLVVYSRGFQPAVDAAVQEQVGEAALDVRTVVELREGAGGAEADPHLWLDPARLAQVAAAVADRLAEADPDRAAGFRDRAERLETELRRLDDELHAGLASCERRELVTSHDAFGYLAERYGLEQVAVSGLSPETEPSPARLAEVTRFAREHGVTTIFFEDRVSPKVAEALAGEVGARTAVLSPLETRPETGDYLSAMRANLQELRTALGCS